MSKKKAARPAMSLKDFHGGSIPGDFHLPSAPGVIVRPVDRGGLERNTPWGNPMGRSDHRLRPASASSARNLDDRTPFLTQNTHIGRNFDEDERKPLDGGSGPRRTVSDDVFQPQPVRSLGPRVDNSSDSRVRSQPASVHVSQGPSGSSYAGSLNSQNYGGVRGNGSSYQNTGGSVVHAVSGSSGNAWGMRKEVAGIKEPRSAAWSAPDAATKMVHASALVQVSSGRWNSKQSVPPMKDAEVLGHPEPGQDLLHKASNVYNKSNYDRLDLVAETGYRSAPLVSHAERSLTLDDGIRGGGKEMPTYERLKSPIRMEPNQRNPSVIGNGSRSPRLTGKPGGIELPTTVSQELTERPKLKLLPRSKPLGAVEAQGFQQSGDHIHVDDSRGLHEPPNSAQSGLTAPVAMDHAVERPKLNLKPRSPSREQLERNTASRGTVFGGARPRELVLKGRGGEESAALNYESQPALRIKQDSPKGETSLHVPPARYSERAENIHGDPRTARYTNRRNQQPDVERTEPQRRNTRNDVRKDNFEKQAKVQERPPSPETWRKPVEEAKPESTAAPPLRYGKAASAVELAQAFSKSVPGTKLADRLSGPGGVPNRGQVPFSRLMGPSPRPQMSQINGY